MIDAHVLAAIQQQDKWLVKILDDQSKEIMARWLQAWNRAEADLLEELTKLASDNPTVSARINAVRASKAMEQISAQVTSLAQKAGVDASELMRFMVQESQTQQFELIEMQMLPIKADLIRSDAKAIDAIIQRSTQNITAKHYVLQAEATEAMKQQLVESVTLGLNPRTAAQQMVAAVHGAFNGGIARATVIARTEQLDAYRLSATATQNANKDVVARWQWIADLSDRTCRSCLSMHGSYHPLSEPGPLDHPQGRCIRAPVTKTWKELGFKGIDEPPSVIKPGDGERWLKAQSTQVQDSILGKAGAEAWRNGNWSASNWSELRSNTGWRDSYIKASYSSK